ncbi:MAG: hypothetical protein WC763_05190 [Candidatus Paceibacterota bacterium]|jgi:hypothetical protein
MDKVFFHPPTETPDVELIRAKFRELFTVQERQWTSDLIQRGRFEDVGAALDVGSPERSYWLDLYLKLRRPHAEVLDSKVNVEIREYEAKEGPIDSPEKAAFWQARLDLEREGKKLPKLDLSVIGVIVTENEDVKPIEDEISPEEAEDAKMSKADIITALEVKGIEYDATAKKADLKALLDA